MISVNTLMHNSGQKVRDAKSLLKEGRNCSAIYLMGYSIEFALKRKICLTLGFSSGFPESKNELTLYPSVSSLPSSSTGVQLKINDLKNHDLLKLLKLSGAEPRVVSNCYQEWLVVQKWNPEDRYKIKRYKVDTAKNFINSGMVVLNHIG